MSTERCPHPWKRRYASKAHAKRAILRSSMSARASVHAYRCECGAWHIGHKRRRAA